MLLSSYIMGLRIIKVDIVRIPKRGEAPAWDKAHMSR